MGSTAFPAANEADPQRLILELQDQNEQLRRRLDDTERKAEVERYMLEKELAGVRSRGHELQKPQAHHLPPGTSSPHRLLHPGHH
jgi:predicted  nucleic acid-binding Zn-ribbon protein